MSTLLPAHHHIHNQQHMSFFSFMHKPEEALKKKNPHGLVDTKTPKNLIFL